MALPRFKLSVHVNGNGYGALLDHAFGKAVEAGFEAVHLALSACEAVTPDTTETACRQVAAAVRRRGLTISGCTLDKMTDAILTSAKKELRKQARDRIRGALDQASWLETALLVLPRFMISPTPTTSGRAGHDDAYHWAGESLLKLRFEAEQRAVAIACSVPATRLLLSPLEVREFIDRMNSPWVGADLDLATAAAAGNSADWITVLSHRIRLVSLENSMPERNGTTVVACLQRARYDGYVTIRGDAPWPDMRQFAEEWLGAP